MSIKSSVVVPAYNAIRTIDTCLRSLADQQGHDIEFEIIVVDDTSTDTTVEHIERFITTHAAKMPAIRLLRQAENRGPAAARNRGALAATGEILLFTDSDCELHPQWLAEMIAPLASPDVAGVKGAYRTRQPQLVARFAQAEFEERYRLLARAERVDVLFSYSAAIRRRVFQEVKGFDTGFPVADNEDTDLSWKICAAGYGIVFNPRALVYHQHPNSVGIYLRKKFSRAYWRACVYRRFPGKALKDSYTPQGLKLQILMVYACVGLAVLAPISTTAGFATLAVLGTLFLTALPFSLRANAAADVRLAAPFLIVARATVMAAGLLWAIPRLLRRDPFTRPAPRSI